jgi:hypothetical protein
MKTLISSILMILLSISICAEDGFTDIFTPTPTPTPTPDSQSGADSQSDTDPQASIPLPSAPSLTASISGELGFSHQLFLDDGWNSEQEFFPEGGISLLIDSGLSELHARLGINAAQSAGQHSLQLDLEELFIRSYFPFGFVDAGLMVIAWGTGESGHAVDPLNPLSYKAGFPDNLNEAKQAELMARINLYLGYSGKVELVYLPFFHPLLMADSGRWAAADTSALPNLQDPPVTETWEYAQAAARISGTVGGIDLGLLYFYGFRHEPGYKFTTTFTGTNPLDPSHYTTTTTTAYTRGHLIGTEAAAAAGPFTFRGELGFWLSEDRDGTETHLYNSRIEWLAGIDYRIPGTTVFLMVEELGSYVLQYDGLSTQDADLMRTFDSALTNTLTAAAEASFARETINVRLSGTYLAEAEGYLIKPEVTWRIDDNLQLTLGGTLVGGSDPGDSFSPFYAWRGNDYFEITAAFLL